MVKTFIEYFLYLSQTPLEIYLFQFVSLIYGIFLDDEEQIGIIHCKRNEIFSLQKRKIFENKNDIFTNRSKNNQNNMAWQHTVTNRIVEVIIRGIVSPVASTYSSKLPPKSFGRLILSDSKPLPILFFARLRAEANVSLPSPSSENIFFIWAVSTGWFKTGHKWYKKFLTEYERFFI